MGKASDWQKSVHSKLTEIKHRIVDSSNRACLYRRLLCLAAKPIRSWVWNTAGISSAHRDGRARNAADLP